MVTVSCLGINGRFGNQLFQYAYARAYAESIGAQLKTPDWIGRHIFIDINEEIMDKKAGDSTESPVGDNVDLFGYFQQPSHISLLSRKKLKEWFRFKEEIDAPCLDLVFHKRRGDYFHFQDVFGIVSDKSYEDAAIEFGFDPNTALVLDDSRPHDLMLYDFACMINAKNLFRANSTFSWWAGVLGNGNVYSPIVGDRTGLIDVKFAKNNDESICKDNGIMSVPD